MGNIKILIADSHALIRETLNIFLDMEGNLSVVGLAQDGLEAVLLCEKLKPDIVLMDLWMPTLDGILAAQKIKEKYPQIKILILIPNQEVDLVRNDLANVVEGYLLKTVHPRILANNIRFIISGNNRLSHLTTKSFLHTHELQMKTQ